MYENLIRYGASRYQVLASVASCKRSSILIFGQFWKILHSYFAEQGIKDQKKQMRFDTLNVAQGCIFDDWQTVTLKKCSLEKILPIKLNNFIPGYVKKKSKKHKNDARATPLLIEMVWMLFSKIVLSLVFVPSVHGFVQAFLFNSFLEKALRSTPTQSYVLKCFKKTSENKKFVRQF